MPAVDPGPIVLNSDVENAVRDTLKAWMPYYLAEIDQQRSRARGTTAAPRTWDTASDNDSRWLEETPPALLVACPGTVEDPKLHGDAASYAATWQVNIGVTVGGATERGARALAGCHAGAILYTLAQQGDMGGLARKTWWMGSRTDVAARDRSVIAVEVLAHVQVGEIVATRGRLPRTPPSPVTDPAAATPTPSSRRVLITRNL